MYGKNEAGKSTIHAFVRSMLFGIPDTKEGNERYSHYLPWETPHDFCGRMWIKKDDKVYSFIIGDDLKIKPMMPINDEIQDEETGMLKRADIKSMCDDLLAQICEEVYIVE